MVRLHSTFLPVPQPPLLHLRYARGYGALWDAWLYQQQDLAARVPYMVSEWVGWRRPMCGLGWWQVMHGPASGSAKPTLALALPASHCPPP